MTKVKVKDYLTADERNNIGVGFIANEAYERIMMFSTKEETKALKKCVEWWNKYAHLVFARVGTKQSEKLVRQFNGGQINVVPAPAYRQYANVFLTAEHVHDLAGPIIETHCRECKRTDLGVCSIRKIFIASEVPTINDTIPQDVSVTYKGVCEYKL